MDTKVWMMSSSVVCQIVFLLALSPTVLAQEWRSYGGDAGGKRASPLQKIKRQKGKKFKRARKDYIGELERGGNQKERPHNSPLLAPPNAHWGKVVFLTPSKR